MNKIEKKALSIHKENMEYFKKNHELLYKKLNSLETAIYSQQYHEKYSLEYKDEGYFDILELSTKSWLYGENSNSYSKNVTNLIDLKKSGGVFEAQRFVHYTEGAPDIIDQSELHFHNGLWATIKIIDYCKNNAPKTTTMKNVYKSVFFGVGLGLYIPDIIQKLNSKVVFIEEDNLELFRLSLFVTNYSKVSKKTSLFFSILEDYTEKRDNFKNFLEKGNNYNLYLKYIPFYESCDKKLELLQEYAISQEHIYYPYNAYLLRYIDAPRYIKEGYPFLNLSKRHSLGTFTKNPILLLFSGPSTGKHIKWIQENKNRFIIVAALSTCRLLYENNIIPDIAVHIDPDKKEALGLLEGIEEDFFSNTTFILSSNNDYDFVTKIAPYKKYFIQQGANYKKDFGFFGAPTVGEFTYGLFLLFGAKTMYLLGIDLAIDPDTFESHSQHHPYYEKCSDNTTQADKMITYIKGNFIPLVPTLSTYKISISEFNRFSSKLKDNEQNVYNLSNGAFLEGAVPLKIDNYDFSIYKNIEQKDKEIIAAFETISSNIFEEKDKEVLRYQLMQAKKLLDIIKVHKKRSFLLPSVYLSHLSKFSWNLSDMEHKTNSDLAEVYYYYFKVVLSYIYDLFNTVELSNQNKHIKEIDAILVSQLEKMGNLFIGKMEDYLK